MYQIDIIAAAISKGSNNHEEISFSISCHDDGAYALCLLRRTRAGTHDRRHCQATWNLTKIVATDGTETVIEAVDSFSYSLGENGTGIATEGDSAYDITYVVSENNVTVNDSGESMPLVYDAENDQLVFTDPDDGSQYIFTK